MISKLETIHKEQHLHWNVNLVQQSGWNHNEIWELYHANPKEEQTLNSVLLSHKR